MQTVQMFIARGEVGHWSELSGKDHVKTFRTIGALAASAGNAKR